MALARTLAKQQGDLFRLYLIDGCEALMARAREDYEAAVHGFGTVTAQAKSLGCRFLATDFHRLLGDSLADMGRLEEADRQYGETLKLAARLNDRSGWLSARQKLVVSSGSA